MADLTHSAKKHLNHTLTSHKAIESGISAEYLDLRHQLDDAAASVKKLLGIMDASRPVWLAVAKHQQEFTDCLAASIQAPGDAQNTARALQRDIRAMHPKLVADVDDAYPEQRMRAELLGYVAAIEELAEKHYPPVELAFTELLRYHRKVDKLEDKVEDKGDLDGKEEDALQRNVGKLQSVQDDYDVKMNELLERMRAMRKRHEAVMMSVNSAFWGLQARSWATIDEATAKVREESALAKVEELAINDEGEKEDAPATEQNGSA